MPGSALLSLAGLPTHGLLTDRNGTSQPVAARVGPSGTSLSCYHCRGYAKLNTKAAAVDPTVAVAAAEWGPSKYCALIPTELANSAAERLLDWNKAMPWLCSRAPSSRYEPHLQRRPRCDLSSYSLASLSSSPFLPSSSCFFFSFYFWLAWPYVMLVPLSFVVPSCHRPAGRLGWSLADLLARSKGLSLTMERFAKARRRAAAVAAIVVSSLWATPVYVTQDRSVGLCSRYGRCNSGLGLAGAIHHLRFETRSNGGRRVA